MLGPTRRTASFALALVGCACTACGQTGGGGVESWPVEIRRENGYVLAIPEGARVEATPGRVGVDAADGSRWYEIREVSPPESGASVLHRWSVDLCGGASWDRPGAPYAGVSTQWGLCTIEGRQYWIFGAIEEHPGKEIVTLYAADRRLLAYEDVWVDLTRTALASVPGESPVSAMEPAAVRKACRDAVAEGGIGRVPVPGGGELSVHVSDRLASVWASRASRWAVREAAPAAP